MSTNKTSKTYEVGSGYKKANGDVVVSLKVPGGSVIGLHEDIQNILKRSEFEHFPKTSVQYKNNLGHSSVEITFDANAGQIPAHIISGALANLDYKRTTTAKLAEVVTETRKLSLPVESKAL